MRRAGDLVARARLPVLAAQAEAEAHRTTHQVGEVVELGALDPECVVTPGIFVQAVVPVASTQRQGLAA